MKQTEIKQIKLEHHKIPKEKRAQIVREMIKIIDRNNKLLKELGIKDECYS